MYREIQEDLKALKFYTGQVDGRFGPMSRAATRTFQRVHGLKPDGSPGSKTQAKLLEVLYGVIIKWRDKQTLVIKIPNPQMDVHTNTNERVSRTLAKLARKPLITTNGTLYSGKTAMGFTIDEGKVDRAVMSGYALVDTGKSIAMWGMDWALAHGYIPREAIGAGPLLILGGKIKFDYTGFDRKLVDSLHPRLGWGVDKEGNVIITVVHGRRPWLGHIGCTIPEFACIMLAEGCEAAQAGDGGGSVNILNRYGRYLNIPTGYRNVDNAVSFDRRE